jgi:chromosome segregation ATPase
MDQTTMSSESAHSAQHGGGASTLSGGEHPSPQAASRYDAMIGTVANLQGDLQRTLSVAQALRDENDKLKANYEAVKADLIRLKQKYAAQRNQLLEAVEAKMEGDRGTEALVQKWKALLEGRTRELESLQSQLAPQDLDMLRAQVAEELEVPHRRKVESMEAEVERQRQMFFSVRREYERCKAEYEQYTIDQAKEAESIKEAHSSEVHTLKMKISDLETMLADSSSTEDVRLLSRHVEELNSAESALRSELGALRSARDKLEVEKHQATISHQSEMAAVAARAAALEADKQTFSRRAEALSADVTRLAGEADGQRARCEALASEVKSLRLAVADREQAAAQARSDAAEAVNRSHASWAAERSDLRQQIETLSQKAFAADRRAKEISERASERVRAAQELEERANRETEAYLASARGEVQSLEVEIERLAVVAQQAEQAAGVATHRLRREVEQQKSEVDRAMREKEATLQRMAQDRAALEKLKHELQSARKEVAEVREEQRSMETKYQDAVAAAKRAETEYESLQASTSLMEQELAQFGSESGALRQSHLNTIKELKAAAIRDREAFAEKARAEIEALRKKSRRALRKSRKRADAYKQLAIQTHKQEMALKKGAAHSKATAISAAEVASLSTALARLRAMRTSGKHYYKEAEAPQSPLYPGEHGTTTFEDSQAHDEEKESRQLPLSPPRSSMGAE